MESDWLAAASLERTQEVLSAINTLSIHAKLSAAGSPDPAYVAAARPARERVLAFLGDLDRITQHVEQAIPDAVVGTDPRMGDFARRFLAGKHKWPRRTPLFALSLPEVRELISSDDPACRTDQIACLAELRSLLEQHAHVDTVGLLGNL
jgi:hypothetical protein